jgi:hypothetical protein
MNQIGLLFKEFNNNSIFLNILREIESDELNEDIILNNVCSSEELMSKFRTFIDDDDIIKEKLVIRISQAKKTYLKNKDKLIKTTQVIDEQVTSEQLIIEQFDDILSQIKKQVISAQFAYDIEKQIITNNNSTDTNDHITNDNCTDTNDQITNESIENNNLVFDYKTNKFLKKYNIDDDNKNSKVQWLSPFIRLEQIGHLAKMTTTTYELCY